MTQKEKDLLLKDLCARLPYGVICADIHADEKFTNKWNIFAIDRTFGNEFLQVCISNCGETYGYKIPIERIKPYLFPLSSMTEEQSMELFRLFGVSLIDSISADYIKINECTGITFFFNKGFDVETHLDKLIDWLNKNHFDYRGLIEKGLANDATGKNIY